MKDLVVKFIDVINLFNKLDSLDYSFLYDEKIKHSEIHMLQSMNENHDLKVSDLADKLGITKGAISQHVKKFEKRGFIKRIRVNDNYKEVYIELSEKGKKIVNIHDEYEREILKDFWVLFDNKSESEKNSLHLLLDELIRIFNEAEKKVTDSK